MTDRTRHYIKLIDMVTGRGHMDINRISGCVRETRRVRSSGPRCAADAVASTAHATHPWLRVRGGGTGRGHALLDRGRNALVPSACVNPRDGRLSSLVPTLCRPLRLLCACFTRGARRYIPGKIVFFLMQVCKAGISQERKIWLTRHGER